MKKLGIIFLVVCFAKAVSTEIVLWHAFEGFLEEQFSQIIEEFNQNSEGLNVKLVQKENYTEAFEEGLAAHLRGKGPHILQVYEVATLSMMLKENTYVPVGELMQRYRHHFDPAVYIEVVRKFYSAPNGKMLSLPWNASTGILFYNKKAFKKAGLDPEKPPSTWPELERMAIALKKKGYVGFTTAWPAAYHIEHVACWHDIPCTTHQNGFGGLKARLNFHESPILFHIEKVTQWSKKGLFSYSGRYTQEPERRFTKGECAILLQGANRLPLIQRMSNFEIGVGYLPYWPHLIDQPANLNIGGGSFWVLSGFSEDEYRKIAKLLSYLSSKKIQMRWHQATGYLPITYEAYHATKKTGFYETHPAAEIAVLEVMKNPPRDHSYGVRLGNYIEVRNCIIDHLEKIFSQEVTPQEGLKQAAEKGNTLLEAFEKSQLQNATMAL